MTGAQREDALSELRAYFFARPALDQQRLHEMFWRRAGERHRMPINVKELAETMAVAYDLANNTIIEMRDAGRIRHVAWDRSPVKVYEIADPATWDPDKPETHVRRVMKWG